MFHDFVVGCGRTVLGTLQSLRMRKRRIDKGGIGGQICVHQSARKEMNQDDARPIILSEAAQILQKSSPDIDYGDLYGLSR